MARNAGMAAARRRYESAVDNMNDSKATTGVDGERAAERGLPRTVHVKLPATGRPLCGYEEESSGVAEGSAAVACPECSALLRSGLQTRRSGIVRG
jgi:hypothetical protein